MNSNKFWKLEFRKFYKNYWINKILESKSKEQVLKEMDDLLLNNGDFFETLVRFAYLNYYWPKCLDDFKYNVLFELWYEYKRWTSVDYYPFTKTFDRLEPWIQKIYLKY